MESAPHGITSPWGLGTSPWGARIRGGSSPVASDETRRWRRPHALAELRDGRGLRQATGAA
eukprot:1106973-Prymnesium_polylepis.1